MTRVASSPDVLAQVRPGAGRRARSGLGADATFVREIFRSSERAVALRSPPGRPTARSLQTSEHTMVAGREGTCGRLIMAIDMNQRQPAGGPVRLGLRANWPQFVLLVVV